ncbi:orotidine-5'-phosphate decarboxylase [Gordonia sp. ABSL1-1]|uniref:orotidine-5'-phosphate decarboxylase n=1 Tax=Gordonia sp. ABSL1-1 TaxID=3053923 RepID=UPI00257335B0|nr:orotidine-5'-phosphate decarboxylase [Gordonia sp. ABSL1-1]MDL9935790.1 orotidine-5'-phosphate decarboxylase [Gordonia sp. ABSL1-1]
MTSSPAHGFAARYRAVVGARGRLCAGIDPHPPLLEQWGLPVSAEGVARFGEICVEALGPTAAVIKPQVAFFEAFGSAGIAALESVIAGCRAAGAIVIADAKRGDIGSTMAAYTTAWLDDTSPLCSDAVTVSPYLGFGALAPALDAAQATDRAIIVLARTSNPEGAPVQLARGEDGRVVGQHIVDEAAAVNADGRGSVGVVVGATRAHGLDLSALAGPILAPGLGAQGATAADLADVFADADTSWLLPASSRGVLGAGPDVAALTAACESTRDEIEAALG